MLLKWLFFFTKRDQIYAQEVDETKKNAFPMNLFQLILKSIILGILFQWCNCTDFEFGIFFNLNWKLKNLNYQKSLTQISYIVRKSVFFFIFSLVFEFESTIKIQQHIFFNDWNWCNVFCFDVDKSNSFRLVKNVWNIKLFCDWWNTHFIS